MRHEIVTLAPVTYDHGARPKRSAWAFRGVHLPCTSQTSTVLPKTLRIAKAKPTFDARRRLGERRPQPVNRTGLAGEKEQYGMEDEQSRRAGRGGERGEEERACAHQESPALVRICAGQGSMQSAP